MSTATAPNIHEKPVYRISAELMDNVPEEIKALRQWVCWRWTWKAKPGKWDKPPFNPHTGKLGATDDPTTWGTLDDALAACDRFELDGVGFVFTKDDPYLGIDIDDCFDPLNGPKEWALPLLEDINSYCEVSPSGKGIKAMVKAAAPSGRTKRPYTSNELGSELMIAPQGRYWTITGDRCDDYNPTIEERQDVIDRWLVDIFDEPKEQPTAAESDNANAKTSGNIRAATVSMLAVEVKDGGDGSKRLYTYACRAVEHDLSDAEALRAIRAASTVNPFPKHWSDAQIVQRVRDAEKATKRGEAATAHASNPVLTCMSSVEPQDVEWLWPLRFGLGKLSVLCGDPGLGKSTIAIDMASRVSTGSPWPDGSPCPLGDVILMTAEDGLADTVRPRLDRQGADPSRVFVLEGVEVGTAKKNRSVTLSDIETVRDVCKKLPNLKLIVIDPVSAYTGEKDSHNNAEIRGVLAPWAQLAEEFGVAVIMVSHMSKGGSGKAIYRTMGSLAFVAAARAAYMACHDPNDANRRLLLPTKNNIGNDREGFAYRFVDNRLVWDSGTVDIKADEAMAEPEPGKKGPKPERLEEATEWLADVLANGAVEVTIIEEQAKAAGLRWATVRRAKGAMPVKAEKCGYTAKWQWRLKRGATQGAQVAGKEDAHG